MHSLSSIAMLASNCQDRSSFFPCYQLLTMQATHPYQLPSQPFDASHRPHEPDVKPDPEVQRKLGGIAQAYVQGRANDPARHTEPHLPVSDQHHLVEQHHGQDASNKGLARPHSEEGHSRQAKSASLLVNISDQGKHETDGKHAIEARRQVPPHQFDGNLASSTGDQHAHVNPAPNHRLEGHKQTFGHVAQANPQTANRNAEAPHKVPNLGSAHPEQQQTNHTGLPHPEDGHTPALQHESHQS